MRLRASVIGNPIRMNTRFCGANCKSEDQLPKLTNESDQIQRFYRGHKISSFVFFIDTWSQWGHWCHVWPYYFQCLQITKSDIRPQVKWAVTLVIADGHFNLPQGLCGYIWTNIFLLSPYRVSSGEKTRFMLRITYLCCPHAWHLVIVETVGHLLKGLRHDYQTFESLEQVIQAALDNMQELIVSEEQSAQVK